MRSVRDRLIMNITEMQQLVVGLVHSIHGQTINATTEQNTNTIMDQIIEKQNRINSIIEVPIDILFIYPPEAIMWNFAIENL